MEFFHFAWCFGNRAPQKRSFGHMSSIISSTSIEANFFIYIEDLYSSSRPKSYSSRYFITIYNTSFGVLAKRRQEQQLTPFPIEQFSIYQSSTNSSQLHLRCLTYKIVCPNNQCPFMRPSVRHTTFRMAATMVPESDRLRLRG